GPALAPPPAARHAAGETRLEAHAEEIVRPLLLAEMRGLCHLARHEAEFRRRHIGEPTDLISTTFRQPWIARRGNTEGVEIGGVGDELCGEGKPPPPVVGGHVTLRPGLL